jgi:2-dehydropantoate 2-reductase
MQIGVFGVGGVGGLLAGLLARAGHDVVVVARGEARRRIVEQGLHVESPLGTFDARVRCVEPGVDPAPAAWLLAVKTWQVPEAAETLARWVAPGSFVVPLQNGVDAPEQCAAALGERAVVGGICRVISWLEGPARVKHIGAAPHVMLGAWSAPLGAREGELREALASAGVEVATADDFRRALWDKMLFIASFGGVAAAARATAGEVRTTPETRALLAAAFEEVRAVARASGVPLADDVAARTMAFVDSLPEAATPSLQRDVIAGRPSELEALSGAVARRGAKLGVPTPAHATILAALLPQERAARARGAVHAAPPAAPARVVPDGYSDVPAGKLAAVVTCLEMRARPELRAERADAPWRLRRVETPDLAWYRALFARIGGDWLWFSRLVMPDAELASTLRSPGVELYAVTDAEGRDEGLLELDFRTPGEAELSFFGLTGALLGQGAGRWTMNRAIERAWSRPIGRFWVHTCTLDHAGALAFYLRSGFTAYARRVEVADDPRLTGKLPRTAAPQIPIC